MENQEKFDFILIGAGIMSATLAVFLKELMPDCSIKVLERLDEIAGESSDAWNNAGTGHAALCEMNYTPENEDGTIDCSKALKIDEQFEISKQFWSFLVEKNQLMPDFIRPLPHMSFVRGEKDIQFLKKRVEALTQYPLFKGMQFSEDPETLKQWIPLMMQGRDEHEKIAATKMDIGTDVNFGALTRQLFKYLNTLPGFSIEGSHEVTDIDPLEGQYPWLVAIEDLKKRQNYELSAKFVFIGAGGGSLHLLEKSKIPEAKGYGGFPVSGQWLRCVNREVIELHNAKVYGKAAVGAPPMSVPHLDSRVINGKKELLFGPYAGFSTKFLKNGSYLDLPASLRLNNIVPMIQAGLDNLQLTKYLIEQVRQKPEQRLQALQEFMPEAKMQDWELAVAGQRVQVIKKGSEDRGKLEFGTELVRNEGGNIVALLGASPGASTAVAIMLDLLQQCFPQQLKNPAWQSKLKSMIPTYGISLRDNAGLVEETRKRTSGILNLNA